MIKGVVGTELSDDSWSIEWLVNGQFMIDNGLLRVV